MSEVRRVNMNIRPPGQPDAQGYSPQRDLAYVYPEMMREAFFMLDEVNWTQAFRERMATLGVTEEMLGDAVGKFTAALELFIRESGIKSPADAFHQSAFDTVDQNVRDILFERFGAVLTGGWFVAVRDVTLRGAMSDAADLIIDMLTAGRAVAGVLRKDANELLPVSDGVPAALAVGKLATEVSELNRALRQSQDSLRSALYNVGDCERRVREREAAYTQLSYETTDTMTAVRAWVSAPFLSRLFRGVVILLQAVLWKAALNVKPTTATAGKIASNCGTVPTSD